MERTRTVQRFTKSLHKTSTTDNKAEKKLGARNTNLNKHFLENARKSENDNALEPKNEALDESQMNQNRYSRDNNNWRHLVNF